MKGTGESASRRRLGVSLEPKPVGGQRARIAIRGCGKVVIRGLIKKKKKNAIADLVGEAGWCKMAERRVFFMGGRNALVWDDLNRGLTSYQGEHDIGPSKMQFPHIGNNAVGAHQRYQNPQKSEERERPKYLSGLFGAFLRLQNKTCRFLW
jgi:hypothetical protein